MNIKNLYLVLFIIISFFIALLTANESEDGDKCITNPAWINYKKKFEIKFSNLKKEKKSCFTYKKNSEKLNQAMKQRKDDGESTYTIGETNVMHVDPDSLDYKGLKIEY